VATVKFLVLSEATCFKIVENISNSLTIISALGSAFSKEKILNKKTLSAQDEVILENELFAILGRVEGYLNNMFENTTKKKLAA
jgi:hypothetical protein